jgi:CubicO group peptidase (beta-lactamase class C family)
MREVIEERPEHDQAGARPAAPARPRPGRAEVALLTVAVLTLAHQVGHVLRADSSGWPFTRDLTWFTASLFVYPALLAALILLRERPWARVTLAVALLGSLQAPHMFWETPADQYGTWAHGVSWMPAAPGRPNLLGTLGRRLDRSRHPDRSLASIPVRLVDPTRHGPPNDFWAQGNHGKFIYVSPSRNVVLVRFGTEYNDDHWPELLAGLARRL